MSARSKPALGWNVACACVPSPLVTLGSDVDGPRPRPRARGTLPLGTARRGPSSLPRSRPEAGHGRGWPGALRRVGFWPLGIYWGEPLPYEGGAELTCRFSPQPPVFDPGARETLRTAQRQDIYSSHSHLPQNIFNRTSWHHPWAHCGMSQAKKGQSLALPRKGGDKDFR